MSTKPRGDTPPKKDKDHPKSDKEDKLPKVRAHKKRKVRSFEEVVEFTTEADLIAQLHSRRAKEAEEKRGPIRLANDAMEKGKETKKQKTKLE